MNGSDLDALGRADRLSRMGVAIQAPSLEQAARDLRTFHASGGNRAMRRSAMRAQKRKGR